MKSYGVMAGLLLASSVLSACAGGPRGGPGRGPPPGFEGAPRGPQVFISPAGEPFRPDGSGVQPMRRWFDLADANRDGVLTPAEFEADQLRFFAIADANADGMIVLPEVARYETQIAPEILAINERPQDRPLPPPPEPGDVARIPSPGPVRVPGAGPMGEGRPTLMGRFSREGPQGAARYSLLNEPQPLRTPDLDYDFKVTRAEWIAASARRFAQLDVGGDGRIAFGELRAPAQPGRRR